jgi:hypothetical protein
MADNDKGSSPSTGGRPAQNSESALARGRALLDSKGLSEIQQTELLSEISDLFCRGINTPNEVRKELAQRFPKSLTDLFQPENYWNLLRLAADKGLLVASASTGSPVESLLLNRAPWLGGRLTVVKTAALDTLASVAARRLLELIRAAARRSSDRTIHVGFAGGRTLRCVAEKLAPLLTEVDPDNPRTLVFHAMVAGFDEDDFWLDPNSFINCFLDRESPIAIRFVRLPMPGIVTSDEYDELRNLPSIIRVLESAKDIQIVITSGSLLNDQSSTIQAFLDNLLYTHPGPEVDELVNLYKEEGVVGDLLWQPVTRQGPLQRRTPYRVATLLPLPEIATFLNESPERRVLAVLGRSSLSGMPKSELLDALLQINPLFTDLVVDTPTLHGWYDPGIRDLYARTPPHKPK